MTKEKLERIKQAYNSGLKIQIWFNGYWEDFDVRDYSMYSEPFSENRQYRIVGSDYADIAEKRIEELEKENAELKSEKGCEICTKFDEVKLTNAKEHIKQLLDCLKQDINDPETNYYVCQYMDKAEQFLKETEK